MTNADIVRDFFRRLEQGDIDGAAKYLSADFVLGEPAPEPVGKARFLELQKQLAIAFPDLSYNISTLSEVDGRVALVMHISGTNTGVIRLPFAGVAAHPPTGKTVRLPYEPVEISLHDGQITQLITSRAKKGGIVDLLEQLGWSLSPARSR